MSEAPIYNIDLQAFWADPYPDLAQMRAEMPVAYVPQLDAILITRRDDIYQNEKKTDVFSSEQPAGLMTTLMGQNMMRKSGDAHSAERKAIFPTISPRTVKDVWSAQFRGQTTAILDNLAAKGACDLVADFAMPVSAEALKSMTGLSNMTVTEMNRVSQGMIDGCANYTNDPAIEANCHDCTASIDRHIDQMAPLLDAAPDHSLLSVQRRAGLTDEQCKANIRLAISGGQNEPRDAIAGAAWALLTHPEQLQLIRDGKATWMMAFEEYARWISPVGMSPRRIAKPYTLHGITLQPESRAFFMFSAGNRDERVFAEPDQFDITRNLAPSIAFGAGPHFCAGAWAAKSLIADVALPMLFDRLQDLRLDPNQGTSFGGWAFRGPLKTPVTWTA